MTVGIFSILVMFVFAVLCHYIASRRGVKPVFWGAMGSVFGPLAVPFVFMAKPNVSKG